VLHIIQGRMHSIIEAAMKKFIFSAILVSLISCGRQPDTVIVVSANAEWKALSSILKPSEKTCHNSPYGQWFNWTINDKKVVFFHGGWGKIDAAGSAQYVIDKFKPELIINIGTAGGFPGRVKKGDVLLVNKTITYDIYEKMGDSKEAVDYYSTELNYPKININHAIKISPIVSADQDLFPEKIEMLSKKYGASAGDWESSAIAHVAKKNNVKCYIIRGITDVVYPTGSATYGDYRTFERETEKVMFKLVKLLEKVL